MKAILMFCAVSLSLIASAIAAADGPEDRGSSCDTRMLRGSYVFTASGFTRLPGSVPGTPWVPKAIVEVIKFNGDGTLTTPRLTVANPFGDSGDILQPPAGGAPGEYTVNGDCSGSVRFYDAGNVAFDIVVKWPRGEEILMIQTNPSDNVFQGTATRIW